MGEGNEPILPEERQESEVRRCLRWEGGSIICGPVSKRRPAPCLGSFVPFLQETNAPGEFAQGREDDPGNPAEDRWVEGSNSRIEATVSALNSTRWGDLFQGEKKSTTPPRQAYSPAEAISSSLA